MLGEYYTSTLQKDCWGFSWSFLLYQLCARLFIRYIYQFLSTHSKSSALLFTTVLFVFSALSVHFTTVTLQFIGSHYAVTSLFRVDANGDMSLAFQYYNYSFSLIGFCCELHFLLQWVSPLVHYIVVLLQAWPVFQFLLWKVQL